MSNLVETIPRRKKTSSVPGSSQASRSSRSSQSTVRRCHRPKDSDRRQAGTGTCAPHTPLLPCTSRTTPIALEPPPNMRTQCVCVVDDTVVTTHRNGVRLYRPSALPGQLGRGQQGVWHLVETRDTFDLRDSYLCTPAQPLITKPHGLCRTKYARYFCVASGSDRSVHSLSVLSTRAHFSVQHTEHQRNRICAVHLCQVAVQPFRADAPIALAVSADEVGGLCLLDVEQERAFTVFQLAQPAPTQMEPKALQRWIASAAAQRGESDCLAYRFNEGIITKVALVGPCLELCPGCHNACSPEDGAASNGSVRRPSLMLLSLVVTTRGQDVVSTEAPTRAQLHTAVLRVVLSDHGAFILWHARLADTEVSVSVCEMGPSLCTPSYADGAPLAFLLGGPRLCVEVRRGCTGAVMHTYVNPSPTEREETEYFVQWLPLGYRRLTTNTTGASRPRSPPSLPPSGEEAAPLWQCALVLTSEGTVLLIGLSDIPPRAHNPARRVVDTVSTPPNDTDNDVALEEAKKLNDWLDDIELRPDTPVVEVTAPPAERTPTHTIAYTTLVELFRPRQGPGEQAVHSVSVDWRQNAALLVLDDGETILSVALPLSAALALDAVPSEATAGTADAGAAAPREGSASAAFGLVGSVWESTSRSLAAVASASTGAHWAAPTRWTSSALSRWRGASAEGPASAPPARPATVPADAVAPAPYSLVRPLAVALATLAGSAGGAEDAVTAANGQPTAEPAEREPSPTPDPPAARSPCAPCSDSMGAPPLPDVASRGSSSVRADASPHPAPSSTAASRHRHRRTAKTPAASTSSRSVVSVGSARGDMDAYMTAQVQQAREAPALGRSGRSVASERPLSSPTAMETVETTDLELLDDAVQQLVDVEEPLARNALFYAWRDVHDTYFIEETLSREQLEAGARHEVALSDARTAETAALYGRRALPDVAQGKHSLHFLTAVDDLIARRQRTRDHRGQFAFAAYFASCQVPQHLLDLQEQDKCRFELRDMERQQAEALEQLSPDSVVAILQNEEKRELSGTKGRTRWESHATFPYDDSDGHTVDLLLLNQQADTRAAKEWRWKTEQDALVGAGVGPPTTAAPDTAAEKGAFSPRRAPQVVAKDLKGWRVGPWQYAAHWPTTPQERHDPHFWSSNDGAACKVRCRTLQRTRVHIPTDTKRRQLMNEHAQQLESLRRDLNL